MTVVRTQYGSIEGEQAGGHVVFRGIPYAKPPVGALRFAPPLPPEPWSTTRSAREFGASCPQGLASAQGMAATDAQSEDCLFLNVYTPAADRKRRPVMVWIHGGGFLVGSASMPIYRASKLAERGDVVVVTINYRLGALGYLSLAEHGAERIGASANVGQLDQIAALRFVRDNIAEFGGDPDNVTIFGESAGSMAVCTLMAMPAAKGLFQRAVAQSGAPSRLRDRDAAAKITDALLSELEISPAQAERLRDVPVESLLKAQGAVTRTLAGLGFAPILDAATLPLSPERALATGQAESLPLVIGTNRDEMNLFLAARLRDIDKPMSDERAVEVLRAELPTLEASQGARMLETYRRSRTARGLPSSNRALLSAMQSDLRFRLPSIAFAEANGARQSNTFMYLFTYESPAMHGALRACHGLEIPFVLGTLEAPFQDRFAGTGPAVEALSENMMQAWIRFARAGSPSHARLPAEWTPYDPQRRATMLFDRECSVEHAPFEEERACWGSVV